VGPIIRTCSLVAVCLVAAMPEAAQSKAQSPLWLYAQARAAEDSHDSVLTAKAYAAALAADPGNETLATQTYRLAVYAGDWRLAQRAVNAIPASHHGLSDSRFLAYATAVRDGDWRGANAALDEIGQSNGFDFVAPILRAWVAVSAHDGDPLAILDTAPKTELAARYVGEARALITMARGETEKAVDIGLALRGDTQSMPLRYALAAGLDAKPIKAMAKTAESGAHIVMLQLFTASMKQVADLPRPVDSAASGSSFLFARLASDILQGRSAQTALGMARFAEYLDPKSDHVRETLARALTANGQAADAQKIATTIGPRSVWNEEAREIEVSAFEALGRNDEALKIAQQAASGPQATTRSHFRLATLLTRLNKQAEAATAYERAISESAGPEMG
jgi:tetratricopeptide (TPR) repeat protein